MALLNFIQSGGGLLEGMLPEYGSGTYDRHGYRMLPEDEARMAQDARDAAAMRLRGKTGGGFDPSLLMPEGSKPDFIGRFDSLLNPPMPPPVMGQPQPLPQAQPPQMPPPMQQPEQPPMLPQMPQAGVPMPTPRPQMQDIAPNGLDRNMTALPSQFASMDGTNPQNRNFPGYSPSPSALDAIPPNAQLAGPARQPVPAPTQEAPQSRGGLGDGFRGLMANAHNGPIGALLGGFAGALGMGEGTPAQIAAQNQKQMFQGYQQLLMSRGMPQAQASSLAMIATMNPKAAEEMMKAPANMEAAIANPYLGTGGAGGMNVGANNPAIQYEANKKAALTKAEAIGKAQASYPTDISTAADTVKAVNDYLADPNLSSIVGMVAGRIPKEIMTEGQRSALARHDQLIGKVFLTAFQMLKGGGQITEVEGAKAQAAQARMDRAVSEKDYREALEEFKQAVSDGARKLSEATGNPVPDFASGRGAPVSRVPAPPAGFMPIKPRGQ